MEFDGKLILSGLDLSCYTDMSFQPISNEYMSPHQTFITFQTQYNHRISRSILAKQYHRFIQQIM